MLGETLVTKSRLVIALRLFRREISASFWDQSQSEGSETVTILDFFTWKQKSKLLNFIWGKMYWINDSSLSLSAMQKKVVMNEVRTPTSHWSGLGFSKSMPESAIKELVSNSTYTDSINLLTNIHSFYSRLYGDRSFRSVCKSWGEISSVQPFPCVLHIGISNVSSWKVWFLR